MKKYKTVNRGWLKRMVVAGKVQARCLYHLTDDYQMDNANKFGVTGWMPVRISSDGYNDNKQGFINLTDDDFSSQCGRAISDEDGIRLSIHSNLSYRMRIAESC